MFETPVDVKGTKLLSWSSSEPENSVWLYLPSLRKTRRLSGTSRYESFMGYSSRKIWVRSDIFLPVKIEFYKDKKPLKRQENSDIRKHQEIWTVFQSTMSNLERSTKTILSFSDLQYNKGLTEKDFSVSRLR